MVRLAHVTVETSYGDLRQLKHRTRSSASGLWSPGERKWSLAVWGLLLGLRGRLGASRGRLYVNEGPERAHASWFQATTTTKRQTPPKRAEFIHQQDRAGFWTLAKRSKTPLLLGRWGYLGACRNLLGPARADKRARNGRFKVKTATKCQKPLWRAELSNNQV